MAQSTKRIKKNQHTLDSDIKTCIYLYFVKIKTVCGIIRVMKWKQLRIDLDIFKDSPGLWLMGNGVH